MSMKPFSAPRTELGALKEEESVRCSSTPDALRHSCMDEQVRVRQTVRQFQQRGGHLHGEKGAAVEGVLAAGPVHVVVGHVMAVRAGVGGVAQGHLRRQHLAKHLDVLGRQLLLLLCARGRIQQDGVGPHELDNDGVPHAGGSCAATQRFF